MIRLLSYIFALSTYCLIFTASGLCGELEGKVAIVVDGDTIQLADGRVIRYIGIDAPEIDHLTHQAEAFGYASLAANRKLVENRRVRLENDRERTDRYGRWLAYVFDSRGRHVNQQLLEKGLAHVLYAPPNSRYWDNFLAAQRKAMKQKIGLWRSFSPGKDPVTGNRGSKRFHTRTCRFGRNIRPGNKIIFDSSWQAFWHGYAPCGRCFPSIIQKSKNANND